MANTVRRIRIFLSSPGDLQEERNIVRSVADEINNDSGRRDDFYIEVVAWETHTRPSVGSHPQDVINSQLPDDMDIYLGLMGNYFGTPTANWRSGTEEEFRISYDLWKKNGTPDIMFYFFEGEVPVSKLDPAHLAQKKDFKKDIGGLGVKYENYVDTVSLKTSLHRHISASVYSILRAGSEGFSAQLSATLTQLPNFSELLEKEPLISVSLLLSDAAKSLGRHNEFVEHLTSSVLRFANNTGGKLRSVVVAASAGDSASLSRFLQGIYDDLDAYRDSLRNCILGMRKEIEGGLVGAQRAINIVRSSRLEENIDISEIFNSLAPMMQALDALRASIESLNDGLEAWPDNIMDLWIYKRQIISLHKDLLVYIEHTISLSRNLLSENVT